MDADAERLREEIRILQLVADALERDGDVRLIHAASAVLDERRERLEELELLDRDATPD